MKLKIFINQIGYAQNNLKIAYVKGSSENEVFELCSKDGLVVYSGKLCKPVSDEISEETTCIADFTSVDKEGVFFIKIQDSKSSCFNIGGDVFNPVYNSLLRYFYLSRCGQKIEDKNFEHEACHNTPALIYGTKIKKSVDGGWHDAGDYGRYIIAASKAVMDLLLAYRECTGTYNDFNILEEVRFELDWMLKMQREDGGVYHKVSCYHFCSYILPQDEKDELVISPVSTAATADFAGCLAFASTFFELSDKEYAEKLLNAAIKAQKYIEKNKDAFFKNPPEITTGGYGDWSIYDEKFFALCSLYVVTKKSEYLKKAFKLRKKGRNQKTDPEFPWKKYWHFSFGWSCVSGYGSQLLLENKSLLSDAQIKDLEEEVIEKADRIMELIEKSAFGVGLDRIFWGSNGAVCDEAHVLLLAYDLTKNKKYYCGAFKQLDYLFGCNPLEICYVTGNGIKSPERCHHRPSIYLKKIMPGMLAGGPCFPLIDEEAKMYLQNKPKLSCYIDKDGSYSTNEVAIYWNSTLVHLIAKLKLV